MCVFWFGQGKTEQTFSQQNSECLSALGRPNAQLKQKLREDRTPMSTWQRKRQPMKGRLYRTTTEGERKYKYPPSAVHTYVYTYVHTCTYIRTDEKTTIRCFLCCPSHIQKATVSLIQNAQSHNFGGHKVTTTRDSQCAVARSQLRTYIADQKSFKILQLL